MEKRSATRSGGDAAPERIPADGEIRLRALPPVEEAGEAGAAAGGGRRLAAFVQRRGGLIVRAAAAVVIAGICTAVLREAADGSYFRLTRLEMTGDTQKVPLARLKEAVEPVAAGRSFFTVDLRAVRDVAETVPWVKYAAVRRVWPDTLRVDVTAYEAAAVFEDGRLVSDDGQLFSANPEEGPETADAPTFSGEDADVPELLRRYRRFSALTANIPARITDVTLTDRGGWSITIRSPEIPPTRIELGREESGPAVEERLRQVTEAYPRIAELLGGPPSSIDARYRRAIAAGKVDRKQLAQYLKSEKARAEAEAEAAAAAAAAERKTEEERAAAAEAAATAADAQKTPAPEGAEADDAADAAASESGGEHEGAEAADAAEGAEGAESADGSEASGTSGADAPEGGAAP